jgi:hypothetical protein
MGRSNQPHFFKKFDCPLRSTRSVCSHPQRKRSDSTDSVQPAEPTFPQRKFRCSPTISTQTAEHPSHSPYGRSEHRRGFFPSPSLLLSARFPLRRSVSDGYPHRTSVSTVRAACRIDPNHSENCTEIAHLIEAFLASSQKVRTDRENVVPAQLGLFRRNIPLCFVPC